MSQNHSWCRRTQRRKSPATPIDAISDEDDIAEMFMDSDDEEGHDGMPVPDESDKDDEPEGRQMRNESDGDAEMSDEDQGRAAAPHKRARLGNLNPSSEALAMIEDLQAVMESSTIKRVIKDLDKLPEFKMKIKKRQQLPTLANGWRTECAEVYSPPRITKIASDMGLRPAWALDLTTVDPADGQTWDFT